MSKMFNGCSNLKNAPKLPATTIGSDSYGYMFQSCTSLESVKIGIGVTNITYDIYASWINKDATDKQKMRVIKWVILISGIFAYIVLQFFPSVLAIQYWAYTISGAVITLIFLSSLNMFYLYLIIYYNIYLRRYQEFFIKKFF